MKRKVFFACLLAGLFFLGTQRAFSQSGAAIKKMMTFVNDELQARGERVRLEVAEYITYSHRVGQTVYFNDRTHRLGHHWVPGDPNRWGTNEIYWLSDQVDGTANGLTNPETQAALSNAMNTWNSQNCAVIPLVQWPDYGIDWGYVQYLYWGSYPGEFGGTLGWYADITHAGWLPGAFFDAVLGSGASGSVLGVTFTFVWVDENGDYTDLDNNHKRDVAFREIYYNNQFSWGIDTDYPLIDVETIVLHETGHGVSLGHFGKLFKTDANGKFHFAPLAVMNAGYTQVQQDLKPTDLASLCSIWAHWPMR